MHAFQSSVLAEPSVTSLDIHLCFSLVTLQVAVAFFSKPRQLLFIAQASIPMLLSLLLRVLSESPMVFRDPLLEFLAAQIQTNTVVEDERASNLC